MMLKVLHLIPSLKKGGAERILLDICTELEKRENIKVVIVTFRKENDYKFLSENLIIKIIPSSLKLSITRKNESNVKELSEFIYSFKPDVIHSHLFETEIILSQINYSRAKYFVHVHDTMKQLLKPRLRSPLNKLLITNAFERRKVLKSYKKKHVTFISISKHTFRFIKKNLPSNFKNILLHNAINTSRFTNTTPFSERVQNKLIMIGSLVEKKGQKLAIETINELKNRGIECHLDILGDGPLRKSLEQFTQELQVETLIKFYGNVDHPEHFLAKASIYLHTASFEPFGLVIIEAMASGVPVVSTDGYGNRDLINNGKNGFLINERNPKLIADQIEILLRDKNIYLNIKNNAFNFSKNFDIYNYTDKLINIYNE